MRRAPATAGNAPRVRVATSGRGARRALAALALAACLAGCATLPPPAPRPAAPAPAPPPPSGPAPGTTVGTTASGGTIRVNPAPSPATAPARVDSTPSAEALAVLETIPNPLGSAAAETLPGRPGSSPAMVAPAAGAAPDDSASGSEPDTAGVPVPEPSTPLGDRPGATIGGLAPESLRVVAPAKPPPPATPAAIPPDSCWRVQVAAPSVRDEADGLSKAASSQLLIAMVVEREGGRYKVRTRDCYTAVAADDLRRRAIASGFEGAFRFREKKP